MAVDDVPRRVVVARNVDPGRAGGDVDGRVHGRSGAAQPNRTYSNSTGLRSTPRSGGAIQLGEPPGLVHRLRHQRPDVLPVARGRQPLVLAAPPLRFPDLVASRGDVDVPEEPDPAVERPVGETQIEVHPRLAEDAVPLAHPDLDVGDEVVAQPFVEHVEGGGLLGLETASPVRGRPEHGIGGGFEPVVVVEPAFPVPPLEPHRVPVRGVGGDLRPEEIQGDGVVEVEVLLERHRIDDPEGPRGPRRESRATRPRSAAPPG